MSYINKFGESFNKYDLKNKNIVTKKYITQINDDLDEQINNLKSEIENVHLKHDNDMKVFKDDINTLITDFKQEIYDDNIKYRNKIVEKFNKIDGEMKVFTEAFKKIEIEVFKMFNSYTQRLSHIEEYLFKSFTLTKKLKKIE